MLLQGVSPTVVLRAVLFEIQYMSLLLFHTRLFFPHNQLEFQRKSIVQKRDLEFAYDVPMVWDSQEPLRDELHGEAGIRSQLA
jgi:hypothetical protein